MWTKPTIGPITSVTRMVGVVIVLLLLLWMSSRASRYGKSCLAISTFTTISALIQKTLLDEPELVETLLRLPTGRWQLTCLFANSVAYVFTIASVLLEGGHDEFVHAHSSRHGPSDVMDATATSTDMDAAPPSATSGGIVAVCVPLFVVFVHFVVTSRATTPAQRSSSSIVSLHALRQHHPWIVMHGIVLCGVVLSCVTSLSRLDTMVAMIAGVVGTMRVVQNTRPLLWMLTDGDAAYHSTAYTGVMRYVEKELMLIRGVVGVRSSNVIVCTCAPNDLGELDVGRAVLYVTLRSVQTSTDAELRTITRTAKHAVQSLRFPGNVRWSFSKCFVECSSDHKMLTPNSTTSSNGSPLHPSDGGFDDESTNHRNAFPLPPTSLSWSMDAHMSLLPPPHSSTLRRTATTAVTSHAHAPHDHHHHADCC